MLKAFSWVVVANLARQIAFLAVNAFLFSRLSRPTFGALALAFGYMTVFAGLGEFGIRQIGWREIARYPERAGPLAGRFLSARLITAIGSATAYLVLMPLLWEPGTPAAIYLAYALPIFLNQSTFEFPLFGLNRLDLYARFSVAAFAAYVLACLTVVTSDDRAWLVPLFFALAMALMLALEAGWLRRVAVDFRLRLTRRDLKEILTESWPIGVAETINRLALSYPVIFIGAMIGTEAVGNYRIAEIGYSLLAQLGYMFASAGFSRLAHAFEHDRVQAPSIASRMLARTFVAALAGGAALSLLGPPVLSLVFESVSQQTLAVLRVLGIALVFAAPARFLRGLLASVNEQRSLMAINALTLPLGLAVAWRATSTYGIVGMAATLVVVEAASLALLTAALRRSVR